MKQKFTLLAILYLLFFIPYVDAQCFEPLPPGVGENGLVEAPLFCSPWDLDGYCGYTFSSIVGSCPGAFCGSCENYQWFAFMATSSYMKLYIAASNCVGTSMGTGLQAQLFSYSGDPDLLDPLSLESESSCWSPGIESSVELTAIGLTVGERYYLMIDGWAGDLCDYVIEVLEAGDPITLGDTEPISEDSEAVEGQSAIYTVPELFGASDYVWSIEPASAGEILEGQGQNSVLINWLQTGTALLCVQPGNACEQAETVCIEIEVLPSLALSYGGTAPTCTGSTDGTVWVDVETGTPPYTFVWNTGDSTMQVENLPEGEYSVVVTDASGQQQTATVVLEVENPLEVNLQPDCEDFSSLIGMPTGGTEPYTFLWNTGNEDPVQGDLEDGLYSLTVTDAMGCTYTDVFLVDETFTSFEAALEELVGPMVCVNEPFLIQAAYAGPNALYQWSFGPNTDVSFSNEDSLEVTPLSTGLMYAHLEVEKYGCIDEITVYIGVTDNPAWCNDTVPQPEPGPFPPGGSDQFGDASGGVLFFSSNSGGVAEAEQIRLSPNPAKEVLMLTFQEPLSLPVPLQIYGMDGRVMLEQYLPKGSVMFEIRVENWPSGLYFLRLMTSNEPVQAVFVVQQ